jgi:hypothetical protein
MADRQALVGSISGALCVGPAQNRIMKHKRLRAKPQQEAALPDDVRTTSTTTVADRASERIAFDLRWYHALFLFAVLTFFCRALLTGTALGLDDAFITYRFAFNNAQGHWFQWNVGEPPVYGTTTFLYTMLLTAVGFFGISIPIASVVISALAQTAAAYFAYLLVRRWCDDLAGLAAGILIAADGFGITATLGLETYLYVYLFFGAVWFYQQERLGWTAVFAALLGMTRPDGFLLSFVLGAHYVVTKNRIPWKPIVVFAVILLPWALTCQELFGSLLPHSFAAKRMHRAINTGGEFSVGNLVKSFGLVPAIALLSASLYYIGRAIREWRRNALLIIGAFAALNLVLYYGVRLPNYLWYYSPPVMGAWVLAAAGIYYFPKKARWFLFSGLCLLSLFVSFRYFRDDPFQKKWHSLPYYEGGQWLKNHARPGQSVAATEVGTIGFYAPQVNVLDVMGLVSPSMISRLERGRIVESVAEWSPNYLFLNNSVAMTSCIFYPDLWLKIVRDWSSTQDPNWLQKWGHWFEDNYEPVQVWPIGNRWWDGQPAYYVLARRKTLS